jgi:hypothetical protein
MATITTAPAPALETSPVQASAAPRAGSRLASRRRITPQAGHALEKLGHAIDYLTDEYVHNGGAFRASDSHLQAIELLMSANRDVYFSCPVVPTLADRWHTWLNSHL